MFHHSRLGAFLGNGVRTIAMAGGRWAVLDPVDTVLGYGAMAICMMRGFGLAKGHDVPGEVKAAISTLSRPDPVILDVGANGGEWALECSRVLDRKCRIWLFEPTPSLANQLRGLERSEFGVVEKAVSDCAGRRNSYVADHWSDVSSFYPRQETTFRGETFACIEVEMTSIDSWCSENEIAVVDFLKMDIEGHELAALHGARRMLERGGIRALSFEFGGGNVNSRTFFRDFWELLHPLGFKIFRLCGGGSPRPIRDYYEDLEYFRGPTNYLAVWGASPGQASDT